MTKLVLASNSPRRKELLMNLGVNFDIIVKEVEEIKETHLDPQEVASENAFRKAKACVEYLKEDAIIIAADTIVYNKQILGKPSSKEEAYTMLKSLSGTNHDVITGIAVLEWPTNKKVVTTVTTKVSFKDLTDEEINKYINSGEPMDKAGAYGIQGRAALFVKQIEGDYFNVVGLPLFKIEEILKKDFNKTLLE